MKKKLIPCLAVLALAAGIWVSSRHGGAASADATNVTTKTSPYCTVLDHTNGFSRCETTEVICYGNRQVQNFCWAKPAAPEIQKK